MVTVELQLPGDLFLSFCCTNGRKHKVDVLLCAGLVGDNAVVVQIPNDRKVQRALLCLDVGYIGHPLLIGAIGMKVAIQQIRITVKLLSVIPIPLPPDFRK